jgi:hypothetical protein
VRPLLRRGEHGQPQHAADEGRHHEQRREGPIADVDDGCAMIREGCRRRRRATEAEAVLRRQEGQALFEPFR